MSHAHIGTHENEEKWKLMEGEQAKKRKKSFNAWLHHWRMVVAFCMLIRSIFKLCFQCVLSCFLLFLVRRIVPSMIYESQSAAAAYAYKQRHKKEEKRRKKEEEDKVLNIIWVICASFIHDMTYETFVRKLSSFPLYGPFDSKIFTHTHMKFSFPLSLCCCRCCCFVFVHPAHRALRVCVSVPRTERAHI